MEPSADSGAAYEEARARLRNLDGAALERLGSLLGADTHEYGDRRLVSYVTVEKDRGPSGGQIRAALTELLPLAMIPDDVVVVEEIVRTAGGKVDRAALRATHTAGERSAASDGDEVQRFVHETWRRVVDLPPGTVITDFFDAGGTSLRALRALHTINAALSTSVPLVAMFRRPRTDLFAVYLTEHAGEAGNGPLRAAASAALDRLRDDDRSFLVG
ncbi:phosphopantetheine-binding protein [Nocardiopsis sp. JB363]|uniref:phosphopantetheine-binding protein n=1 Tax=Nocardiopsis sp. JB363 TaxID=1434837 RepID=UPI000B358F69|nr:phosphopantetheine-binding protein [Nocardiopsis sp. JB363]